MDLFKHSSLQELHKSCTLSAFVTAAFFAVFFIRWSYMSPPGGAASTVLVQGNRGCGGRRIYIYDLPPEFNSGVVESVCGDPEFPNDWICRNNLQNGGLGLPARVSNLSGIPSTEEFPEPARSLISACRLVPSRSWFRTGQYSLEILTHERMKTYECRTSDPEQADVFYIPYYIGIDVFPNLYTTHVQLRDKLGYKLMGYLEASPYWRRNRGRDHVLVFGRVIWDFRRWESDDGWGSSLLSMSETDNMTKMAIERDPNDPSQVAVPYPTGFHPSSAEDLGEWMDAVRESPRVSRVSFVAAPRPGDGNVAVLRRILRQQCEDQVEKCKPVRCEEIDCDANTEVMNCIALDSVFCLMPPGDSPTRKGLFDSLLSGCIPVVFSDDSAHRQYLWHLPENATEYTVFIGEEGVINGSTNVIQELDRIPYERVRELQRNIWGIIPRIIYAGVGSSPPPDAFEIIIHNLLQRNKSNGDLNSNSNRYLP